MSYLNADERKKLADELAGMRFNQAKWKLLRMDPQGRMKYFRNVQRLGYLATRFELPTYNARVTLFEVHKSTSDPLTQKISGENRLAEVIVEPISETSV